MFGLFKQAQEEELVILVLESEYNEDFDLKECIILAVPSNASIEELKLRIQGTTDVSCDRIILLYCGQVLSGPKTCIPPEAFELPGVVDEDTATFKARICMLVIADPVVYVEEEEPDAERRVVGDGDDGPQVSKEKHKKKVKTKGQFDLATELAQVQCEPFLGILTKEGYDNEVRYPLHGSIEWVGSL
jgi:hypothetical protein